MKKTIKTLGKIALVLIIAFSFASCFNILDDLLKDDDKGGGGGGSDTYSGGGGGSGLTITGLPSGAWMVYVFPAGTDVSTSSKISAAAAASQLEAGTAGPTAYVNVFPLFRADGPTPWTGSGNRKVVIWASSLGNYWATVNFSNGNATVPFSSFTKAN
jgi:hypothetical protein